MKKAFFITLLLASLQLCLAAESATCPTQFRQSRNGYWISDNTPGWKSTRPSHSGVTLSAKDFGGAVFSVDKKRIACVYRGSHQRWIGLLSNPKHPFEKSNLIGKNWKFNPTHRDYICGTPEYKLNQCRFKVDVDSKNKASS